MTSRLSALIVLPTLIALSCWVVVSCASVKNVDQNDTNVGFEHFAGKHYLVVEPTKDGGKQIKVITLPDLSKPRKIKYKPGWGSVQFSYKLQNGVLTEFGNTTDMKGPETLAAVGATVATLGTGYASLLAAQIAAQAASAGAWDEARKVCTSIPVPIMFLVDSAQRLWDTVDIVLEGRDPYEDSPILRSVREDFTVDLGCEGKQSIPSISICNHLETLLQTAIIDPCRDIIEEIAGAQKATFEIVKALEKEEQRLKVLLKGDLSTADQDLLKEVSSALADEIRVLRSFAMSGKQPVFYEIRPKSDGSGIEFLRAILD